LFVFDAMEKVAAPLGVIETEPGETEIVGELDVAVTVTALVLPVSLTETVPVVSPLFRIVIELTLVVIPQPPGGAGVGLGVGVAVGVGVGVAVGVGVGVGHALQ
jgi:hypothetical protein